MNAFTLWPLGAVKITKGADNIQTFNKTPLSGRKWCKTCGGHIMTEHPTMGPGLMDVYAATIPEFPFHPGVHVNYSEKVVSMKDGLPKQKDVPAEMGGSGVLLPD